MSGGRVELGHRRRLVRRRARRLRHPVPAARRAVRPARGAARDHHRAVGRPRTARRSPSQGKHYRSPTRRPCPSRCSGPARRSSSAAAAPKRTPRLAARFADEFNLPFLPVDGRPGHARPRATPPARRSAATRPRSLWSAAAGGVLRRRRGRGRPPGDGHRPRARRAPRERCGRHAGRGGRDARPASPTPAPPASTSRSSTSTTSTTSASSPPRSSARCDRQASRLQSSVRRQAHGHEALDDPAVARRGV